MSKSILIIDTPKKCSDCPCFTLSFESYCSVTGEINYSPNFSKLRDCPLKPYEESDERGVSANLFKLLANTLPDDGVVRIRVEKDYGNRTRTSLEKVDGIRRQGKILEISCKTLV